MDEVPKGQVLCISTKLPMDEIKIQWHIPNLSEIIVRKLIPKFSITSDTFICDRTKTKWKLDVYRESRLHNPCTVYLYQTTDGKPVTVTKVIFELLDPETQKTSLLKYEQCPATKSTCYLFKNFPNANELLKPNTEYVKNDTLLIACTIRIFMDSQLQHQHFQNLSYNVDPSNSFTLHLPKNLLILKNELQEQHNSTVCKLSVEFIENSNEAIKVLTVHQAILSEHSPVFKSMLESNMKEGNEKKVTIIDFHPDIVEEMIEFLYTGNIKDIQKNVYKLLQIADKYEIECLKNRCEHFIMSNISIDNVIDTLILADAHNFQNLKSLAMEYFSVHKEELKKMDKFDDLVLGHPQIILELFRVF